MPKETLEQLRQKKNELIWSAGSAREIMRLSRLIFKAKVNATPGAAYLMLASDHYSLVKRYRKPWNAHLGIWHLWRAAVNASWARHSFKLMDMNADQIDVVTRIWVAASRFWKSYAENAQRLLEWALGHPWPQDELKPHTQALMLISLGAIHHTSGHKERALRLHKQAAMLEPEIRTSRLDDALKQLVRVKSAVGCYLYDHGNKNEREVGANQLTRAWVLSKDHSKDQQKKIETQCRKRGISLTQVLED